MGTWQDALGDDLLALLIGRRRCVFPQNAELVLIRWVPDSRDRLALQPQPGKLFHHSWCPDRLDIREITLHRVVAVKANLGEINAGGRHFSKPVFLETVIQPEAVATSTV